MRDCRCLHKITICKIRITHVRRVYAHQHFNDVLLCTLHTRILMIISIYHLFFVRTYMYYNVLLLSSTTRFIKSLESATISMSVCACATSFHELIVTLIYASIRAFHVQLFFSFLCISCFVDSFVRIISSDSRNDQHIFDMRRQCTNRCLRGH